MLSALKHKTELLHSNVFKPRRLAAQEVTVFSFCECGSVVCLDLKCIINTFVYFLRQVNWTSVHGLKNIKL